jgi:hypothetical protein
MSEWVALVPSQVVLDGHPRVEPFRRARITLNLTDLGGRPAMVTDRGAGIA